MDFMPQHFNYQSIAMLLAFLPVYLGASAVLLFVFKNQLERITNIQLFILGSGFLLLSCFLVYIGLNENQVFQFEWFNFGKPVNISFGLDNQGSLMLGLVAFITLLVIVYSISYMKHEKGYARYFASLFLFAAAMIGIVFSFNLLLTFICWELVGFCSYLLINFWYKKPSANEAARKAFIANRIGDLGFVMGIGLLYAEYGTFELNEIILAIRGGQVNELLLFWAGLGVFFGCVGKSAQFPLLVWLPDAMQAPTPVSALLHAATMVAAGIFLLARVMPILLPDVLTIIAYIGAITSVIGAFSAASQTDIKKILAYSTVSQLGYMVAAIGAHAYFAPLLHLFTHAIFKACLFLCAGAIIHAMAHIKHYTELDFDPQDIRLMGGLRKRMPLTFVAFLFAALASAGVPLSAGFLSKDEILVAISSWAAIQSNPIHFLLPFLIFCSSLMTAFYTGRMFFLIFFGGFRLGKFVPELKGFSAYIHEAPKMMLATYLILAPLCLFVFFSFNPIDPDTSWLANYLTHPSSAFTFESDILKQLIIKQHELHYWIISFSMVVLTLGFGLAYVLYGVKTKYKKEFLTNEPISKMGLITRLSYNGLYLNQIYQLTFVKPFNSLSNKAIIFDKKWIDKTVENTAVLFVASSHLVTWFDKNIVDGSVTALMWLIEQIGFQLKKLQNGKVQSYISLVFVAILIGLAWALI
jgi:NADH-quinone oxidoreductase subunit L